MNRRFGTLLLLVACAIIIPGSVIKEVGAQKTTVLRMATLIPSGTSVMKVLNAWNRTIQKETKNQVKLRIYPGGSQGDEKDFVRKMRAGQMDGAFLSVVGLGVITRPALVLTAPGLVTEYDQLARVRKAMHGRFVKIFDKAGYKIVGWGDNGKLRLWTNKSYNSPSDMKSMRPWAWKDDFLTREVWKVVGASPVMLGVPEVYPALQTKMVDAVVASALSTVALQWHSRLKYVSNDTPSILIGAFLIKKNKFNALTPAQQKVIIESGKRFQEAVNKISKRDDEKSYASVQKRGIKVVNVESHRSEWDKVFATVRKNLIGRVYSKELLQAVEKAAKK